MYDVCAFCLEYPYGDLCHWCEKSQKAEDERKALLKSIQKACDDFDEQIHGPTERMHDMIVLDFMTGVLDLLHKMNK